MQSLGKKTAIVIGCLVLAIFLMPPATHADEWNLATRFTINQSFRVPGMILQPNTPYVIRIMDSPAQRNVVQIYNGDETRMLTMFMAVSDERPEPEDHTTFTFIETARGFPLPIREWFYPGRLIGLEFVYPKSEAAEIARHSNESVLSAKSIDLHDLKSITVESTKPVGTQAPVAESAANITQSETTTLSQERLGVPEPAPAQSVQPQVEQEPPLQDQNVEIAQNPEPVQSSPEVRQENEGVQSEAPSTATTDTNESKDLPRTAGELPLVALISLLSFGAAAGLKIFSKRA